MLKIATWNINSVRLRASLVARLLGQAQPDILCLQEIKCRGELFPREVFLELGYKHIAISGQPGYHGVATISKLPLQLLPRESFCGTAEARHLGCAVELPGGATLDLHNIYVPAGGDIPDPALNPKFKQKLSYLASLAAWRPANGAGLAMLLGDFNVAPLETDVWSHKQLLKVVSHTPVEVEALTKVRNGGEWADLVRHFIPPEQKLYTWWSYRARDWQASDRGRRLDHIWASAPLAERACSAAVLREVRGWHQPSDHVPVVVELDLDRGKGPKGPLRDNLWHRSAMLPPPAGTAPAAARSAVPAGIAAPAIVCYAKPEAEARPAPAPAPAKSQARTPASKTETSTVKAAAEKAAVPIKAVTEGGMSVKAAAVTDAAPEAVTAESGAREVSAANAANAADAAAVTGKDEVIAFYFLAVNFACVRGSWECRCSI